MNKRYFISGIHTDAGKTVASAVLVRALGAAYWKPVQAGDLELSDTCRVQRYLKHIPIKVYPEAYRLPHPLSPHASAARAGISIDPQQLCVPKHETPLVIEGAGGLLVPLNANTLYIDVIAQFEAQVILVSRMYLGSINHTLMSVEALKNRGIPLYGILFNGAENRETESIIASMTGARILGRLEESVLLDAAYFDREAEKIRELL
jgi:dethiobiotin synthetase